MKQGTKRKNDSIQKAIIEDIKNGYDGEEKQKYGTSKLEELFANDFLKKNDIKYIYQFEAKDIHRYYDFYLPDRNTLIEVDGDYWHCNPIKFKKKNLVQYKSGIVDTIKDNWAKLHGIKLIRIWENDIRNNSQKVNLILENVK